MNAESVQFLPVLPEIVIAVMACLILVVDLYIKDENPENAYKNISSDHLKTIEELTGKAKQLEQ